MSKPIYIKVGSTSYYAIRQGKLLSLRDPRPWYGKFSYRDGRNQETTIRRRAA